MRYERNALCLAVQDVLTFVASFFTQALFCIATGFILETYTHNIPWPT